MKRSLRFLATILSLLFLGIIVGCSDNQPDTPDNPETPGKPDPVRRTVLVYMVADNSLGTYDFDKIDIREMLEGASNKGIAEDSRWLVYHAPKYGSPKLIEITANDSTTLKTYPRGGSATLGRMTEVLDDVVTYSPASSYGLVLWSHASNWIVDGVEEDREVATLSFGIDGSGAAAQKMDIATLRYAMLNRNIDYVYFDACFMGSVEVAYELRDACNYVIASPSELPSDGMPYQQNMVCLTDGSVDALVNAAQNTFDYYNAILLPYYRTCTMSVIDTRVLERLAQATAAIYKLTPLPHPGTLITNYRADISTVEDAIDFGEYVNALAESSSIDPALISEFNAALEDAVVYKDATEKLWNKYPIYHASGLSTYVFDTPAGFAVSGYDTLRWAKDVVSQHLHD